MARPLRVKRLDSPIARRGVVALDPPPPLDEATASARSNYAVAGADESVAPESSREADAPVDRLPPPPPLDEQLEFISGRVPASLALRLNALTLALRQRQATRTNQKGLPQQEVLAVLLWAAGDPDDPQAVDSLAELHARFRAGRYAAAAARLSSS